MDWIRKVKPVTQTKNYLLNLLQHCSEENFGQQAIEWALVQNRIALTYQLEADVAAIMARYSEFIEAYQAQCREQGDALVQLYHAAGLMEEILRPVPLHGQLVEV